MSTFYVLPPGTLLAHYLAEEVLTLLPGLDLDVASRERLWLAVSESLGSRDIFLVHREDLPVGQPVEQALVDGCGASAADEIVEIRLVGRTGALSLRVVGASAKTRARLRDFRFPSS